MLGRFDGMVDVHVRVPYLEGSKGDKGGKLKSGPTETHNNKK
jgi:hypothetical protein